MSYWNHKEFDIFLTTYEENELVRMVEPDDYKQAMYKIVSTHKKDKVREEIHKKMESTLLKIYKSNPKKFRESYEVREFHGDEARKEFPHFLGRYETNVGLAKFGRYIADCLYEENNSDEELYFICLTKEKGSIFQDNRINNYISFPSKNIISLTGSTKEFVLKTISADILFSNTVQIRIR